MGTTTSRSGRIRQTGGLVVLSMALMGTPLQADYNPQISPEPGGVAVIELPNSIGEGTPEVYFRGQRVYTMNRAYNEKSDDRWVAWIGLSQNLAAGKHTVQIRQPGGRNRNIYLDVVEPEQSVVKRIVSNGKLRTGLTPAQENRIRQEKAMVDSIIMGWQGAGAPDKRPFLHPTSGGSLIKPFGQRVFYNNALIFDQKGVDLNGQRVLAPADGRIVMIRDMFYEGTHVIIDHGGGLFTQYSHLDRVNFRTRQGQAVRRGEEIGKVGRSGRQIQIGKNFAAPINTPYLHWRVSLNGVYVNPELFLEQAETKAY